MGISIIANDNPFDVDTNGLSVRDLEESKSFIITSNEHCIEVYRNPDGTLTDGNSIASVSVRIPSQREEILRRYFAASNRSSLGHSQSAKTIKAPMPGLVKAINIEVGQFIDRDMPIIILEAMKMENAIKAGISGRVASIHTAAGKNVEKNEVLVKIEE